MNDPHPTPGEHDRRHFGPPWQEDAGRKPRGTWYPGDLLALARLVVLACWFIAMYSGYLALRAFAPKRGRKGLERACRRRLSRDVLRLMGLRLRFDRVGRTDNALVVANHVSWIDALVILASSAPAPVALRRSLPGFNALARSVGSILIERSSLSCLAEVVDGVERALALGEDALFFPEATTGFGGELKPFHAALFEAAVRTRKRCACALVAYRLPEPQPSPERVAHWVDWVPFPVHFWRVLGLWGLEAHLRLGAVLAPPESRRAACAAARAEIGRLATAFPPAPLGAS